MKYKDMAGFQADLQRFASQLLPDQVQALGRKIALDALTGVVFLTPVDTGRAKGNWQVSLDVPAEGVVDVIDRSGLQTISRGQSVIAQATRFPTVIWITNNLPYIDELENGSSTQAPNGMVAVTLERLGLAYDR
jgi:hypothetical protein